VGDSVVLVGAQQHRFLGVVLRDGGDARSRGDRGPRRVVQTVVALGHRPPAGAHRVVGVVSGQPHPAPVLPTCNPLICHRQHVWHEHAAKGKQNECTPNRLFIKNNAYNDKRLNYYC
jgi:hypothetical protein